MDPKVIEDRTSGLLAKLQTHVERPMEIGHRQPTGHRPPGIAESVAAMVAEGGGELSTCCGTVEMELDDDTLTQMVEAVLAPAVAGDSSAEERASRLAEAKIRLSKVSKFTKHRSVRSRLSSVLPAASER